MSVYTKLQECRVELQSTTLKKSGKNKHLGFEYFELGDFLPKLNEMFHAKKLFSKFDLDEVATLTIIDTEDNTQAVFTSRTAPATLQKATPVQELGAEHTYIKRYLYVNALEIVENDVVDLVLGDKAQEPKQIIRASANQIKELRLLFTEAQIPKLLERANVKSIEELSVVQASDYIKKMQDSRV
jgi:hypothetical protein